MGVPYFFFCDRRRSFLDVQKTKTKTNKKKPRNLLYSDSHYLPLSLEEHHGSPKILLLLLLLLYTGSVSTNSSSPRNVPVFCFCVFCFFSWVIFMIDKFQYVDPVFLNTFAICTKCF